MKLTIHQLLHSVEVRKTWVHSSTPGYAFMVYCLISLTQGQLRHLPYQWHYDSTRVSSDKSEKHLAVLCVQV
jgi:hypothetical protein